MVILPAAINDAHVGLIGGKVLGPTGLAAGEVFLGEEVSKAVMVGVEGEMQATLKVVAENLDGVDDGKELKLMDGVVFLGGG